MESTLSAQCPDCHARFVNGFDLDEHQAMVHDEKWHGNINQSENGDSNAGAIPPTTADHVATDEGLHRPSTEERAARQQGRR